MANTPETVADVLSSMKATADNLLAFHKAYPDGGTANDKVACGLARWYMRFNDAYTREIADYKLAHEVDGEQLESDVRAFDKLQVDILKLKAEIERLRRALKPVLAVHLCDGGQQVVSDALCAIREAQETMKGETK